MDECICSRILNGHWGCSIVMYCRIQQTTYEHNIVLLYYFLSVTTAGVSGAREMNLIGVFSILSAFWT